MCCMCCGKHGGMHSEELGIRDGIFEVSVMMHLVSKDIVVESGIRDVFF